MRAYVQGMPATMVVARYLSDDADDDDGSSALRTLLGLRDRMVQLAHLHGRQDLAELLELGPGRSNRGMDRRVDALSALERLGTALPRAGHGVELWFGPSLARRLRKADIVTLEALVGAANTRGGGWWRAVPRIGALAGLAINHWLGQHREVLKCDAGKPLLASHVGNRKPLAPGRLSPEMGQLLPIEWMAEAGGSGDSLAGAVGESAASCTYSAGIRAVRAWLDAAAPGSAATRLAYRKEAERLLLWAAVERSKGLEALDGDDCSAYLAFLASPTPTARWCGPRAPRQSAGWRPFTGPLSPSSIRHAVRVLAALSAWMTRHGYRCGMSWGLPAGGVKGDGEVGRRRTRHGSDAIAPFLAWLQDQGLGFEAARLRAAEAAVRLMRERELGVERLAMITLADLAPPAPAFCTEAEGVAGEPSHPALSAPTRMALARHWQDRGLDWDSPPADDIALVGPPRPAPTARARRKLAVTPHPGYSVRGLHALLSAALRRYREERNDGFPVRTPRDLQR